MQKASHHLSPDELQRLKLPYIQICAQLIDVEAANILQGQIWLSGIGELTSGDIFNRGCST